MKKALWIFLGFLIVGLLVFSFIPTLTPAAEVKTAAKLVSSATKADWQQKWEGTLAEAKKEGRVSLYNEWSSEARVALTKAFKDKYGIEVETTPFGRPAEHFAKIQAEQRAGVYMADVLGSGLAPLMIMFKPAGLLGSLKPLLILPEVLDSKVWLMGEIPFIDPEGTILGQIAGVYRHALYNSDLVKEGEITSIRDLLKPQYKGKIIMDDPTQPGPGSTFLAHLGHNVWNEAQTTDFFRRLIKDQEVVFQRDARIHIESVARGKYSICLAPKALWTQFFAAGAPLKAAMLEEDSRLTSSWAGLGVPTRFPHPNAAIVFINWLLTKEGQSIMAKAIGQPSMRTDASMEGVFPAYIPVPGKKYHVETLSFLKARGPWIGLSKRIIEETMK